MRAHGPCESRAGVPREHATTVPVAFRERLRSFLTIFRYDLSAAWKGLLAVFLLFSVIFALLFPLLKSYEDNKSLSADLNFSVSVVDEANSFFGELFVEVVKDVPYLKNVYFDTLEQARERLESDEIILYATLPPDLFQQVRSGSVKESVQLFLNPRKAMEAASLAALIRQYYFAVDHLYSAVFGYQREFMKLGGDEDESWEQTTKHALNALSSYFTKHRFAEKGSNPDRTTFFHALSGILILLSFIPALGVLYQTSRLCRSDLENRMILIAGRIPLAVSRILTGLTWWLVLILPWLIALRVAGVLNTLLPTTLILIAVYLMGAFLMLFVGRANAATVSVYQVGWLIFFALLLFGGVFYPTSLFPSWMRSISSFTPMHAPLQALFTALTQKGHVPKGPMLLAFWPILPTLALAFISTGRRRSGT
ncbi:MAG: ABC transporter permease [Bacillota bacterium]|nr:ABC transporter permease [Bacillota bacterium]